MLIVLETGLCMVVVVVAQNEKLWGHFGTLASTAELQLTFQDTDLPNGPDKAICNQMPASGHFSTVCFMVYKPPRNKSRASRNLRLTGF